MIPVLDQYKNPLMPCSNKRARKLLEKKQAKPYWYRGLFSIILQRPPKSTYKQDIVVGVDPGSKFEGFTVKSKKHTLLNIQSEAKTDVKDKLETRRNLRRSRRSRKCRYRKPRWNRASLKKLNRVPPSTKSRWDWKLHIIYVMMKLYPISIIGLENIAAKTKKNCKKWNSNFSPIECGKNYFRKCIKDLNLKLIEYQGYETYSIRKRLGLKKNSGKSKKDFHTHCVDSWCISNDIISNINKHIDSVKVIYVKPLLRYRRQLHVQTFSKGGIRKKYGSTRSLGLERGSIVKHPKHGICLVGGTSKNRISLHSYTNYLRLTRSIKIIDIHILSNNKWNIVNKTKNSGWVYYS